MLLKSALRSLSAAGLAATIGAFLLAFEPTVRADPVLKVVDGDTVDIRDDVRGRLRIRLLGIDTPETHKPGYRLLGSGGI
jgi:micrococcal nuclease